MKLIYIFACLGLVGCGGGDSATTAANNLVTTPTGCTTATSGFASGSGTVGDPYTICNATQLANIHSVTNKNFSLSNNIDMSGVSYSVPLSVNNFSGNGYTISNLTISGAGNTGFIYQLNGTLNNLTVTGLSVTATASSAGLVTFTSGGVINNVSVAGAVTGTTLVGCLVADAVGATITNSTAKCTLSSSGGITGEVIASSNGSTLTNNTVNGSMNSSAATAGGLIGFSVLDIISGGSITITLTGTTYVGGVIGDGDRVSLTSVTEAGTVTGSDTIGSIAGYLGTTTSTKSTVTSCSPQGTVNGGTNAGRLIGNANATVASTPNTSISFTGTAGPNSI